MPGNRASGTQPLRDGRCQRLPEDLGRGGRALVVPADRSRALGAEDRAGWDAHLEGPEVAVVVAGARIGDGAEDRLAGGARSTPAAVDRSSRLGRAALAVGHQLAAADRDAAADGALVLRDPV